MADGENRTFWVKDPVDLQIFKDVIADYLIQNYTFVSFNVEAEASALLSLGIDPLKMKWIDLYLEYVMLSNHNNALSKGEQYMKGEVKIYETRPV